MHVLLSHTVPSPHRFNMSTAPISFKFPHCVSRLPIEGIPPALLAVELKTHTHLLIWKGTELLPTMRDVLIPFCPFFTDHSQLYQDQYHLSHQTLPNLKYSLQPVHIQTTTGRVATFHSHPALELEAYSEASSIETDQRRKVSPRKVTTPCLKHQVSLLIQRTRA